MESLIKNLDELQQLNLIETNESDVELCTYTCSWTCGVTSVVDKPEEGE